MVYQQKLCASKTAVNVQLKIIISDSDADNQI